MKKVLCFLFITIMMIPYMNLYVFADNTKKNSYIEYLDDGSYYVTEITYNSNAKGNRIGEKSKSYYNNNGSKEWTVTIQGAFTYNGSSAICTSATPSSQVFNNKWRVTSAVGTKSGNSATGTFVVKKYVLGVAVKTVNETVTLTCSANGTLS